MWRSKLPPEGVEFVMAISDGQTFLVSRDNSEMPTWIPKWAFDVKISEYINWEMPAEPMLANCERIVDFSHGWNILMEE